MERMEYIKYYQRFVATQFRFVAVPPMLLPRSLLTVMLAVSDNYFGHAQLHIFNHS